MTRVMVASRQQKDFPTEEPQFNGRPLSSMVHSAWPSRTNWPIWIITSPFAGSP